MNLFVEACYPPGRMTPLPPNGFGPGAICQDTDCVV